MPDGGPPGLVAGRWETREAARPYGTEAAVRQSDAVAVSLSAALARVVPALAKDAAALAGLDVVHVFGYVRLGDYARERLGRSGRWVSDLARLHAQFERLPALRAAVTGEDGGSPLHVSAALAVGAVATDSDAAEWIDLARRVTLASLRMVIRAGKWPGSTAAEAETGAAATPAPKETATPAEDDLDGADCRSNPGLHGLTDSTTGAAAAEATVGGDAEGSGDAGSQAAPSGGAVAMDPAARPDRPPDDADDWSELRLHLPSLVRAAFRETLDLYRAVEGTEASVTSFVEAPVAESSTEPTEPTGSDGDRPDEAWFFDLRHGAERDVIESALDRAADGWKQLHAAGTAACPAWAVRLAGSSLARLRRLERRAGQGDARALDSRMRQLLALHSELEMRLGEVLNEMGATAAWMRLGFAGVGHYAERRLGISRTAAEDRVWVARTVRAFPLVRMAYERGELGWEATRHILRVLKGHAADEPVQRVWIERGRRATVKRLGDEVKALQREEALSLGALPGGCPPRGALPELMHEALPGRALSHRTPPSREAQSRDVPPEEAMSRGAQSQKTLSRAAGAPTGTRSTEALPGRALLKGALQNQETLSQEALSNRALQEDARPRGVGLPEVHVQQSPEGSWVPRAPLPMSDEAWHASVRREHGSTRQVMDKLGRALVKQAEAQTIRRRVPEGIMRLRLPSDLARGLVALMGQRCRELRRLVRVVPEFDPWPDPLAPASVLATRIFSIRGWREPLWVGLLAMLEDFVEVWDSHGSVIVRRNGAETGRAGGAGDGEAPVNDAGDTGGATRRQGGDGKPLSARRSRIEVFARRGYRCSAPGCTSRMNLHDPRPLPFPGGRARVEEPRMCLRRSPFAVPP